MKVFKSPTPITIELNSEEASYLIWILCHGLPDNPRNRIEVIRWDLFTRLSQQGLNCADHPTPCGYKKL